MMDVLSCLETHWCDQSTNSEYKFMKRAHHKSQFLHQQEMESVSGEPTFCLELAQNCDCHKLYHL